MSVQQLPILVKPDNRSRRGGVRANSGRKPDLDTQLARAEKLARRLQIAMRAGLGELAEALPELFAKEIEAAKRGDSRARQNLIDIALRLVQLDERPQKPMAGARQQFQINVGVTNVERDSQRPIETVGYTIVPGATGGGDESRED